MPATPKSVLALDVGEKRIGVALTSLEARLPRALVTLSNDENFISKLTEIVNNEAVDTIVIGLPRGLNGQHTGQTETVEDFAKNLSQHLALPMIFQDEAVTSKRAEAELEGRGKPYQKSDIDALAAVYILEDWLSGYNKGLS